jgi:alpha-beta hydrolase superfamily lysophospholipase
VGRFDLRGHGRSHGRRGDLRRFDDYLRDVDDVIRALDSDDTWAAFSPPVVFGHSMGALLALTWALRHPEQVRGLALSSPYLALAMKVPAWKIGLGKMLSGVAPSFALDSGLAIEMQTSCPEMQAQCLADPYRFPEARARWLTETQRAQQQIALCANAIDKPLLCLAAGADRIADLAQTRRVIESIPGAELRIVPNHQHEILHEVERATHIDTYASWIEQCYASGGAV